MINNIIKKLTTDEIFSYLSAIDNKLIPPLSSRVDIRSYSEKLQNKAVHFCVFDNDSLIAMAACYFNDPAGETGFITSFSVKENYHKKGIGTRLLKMITGYAEAEGFKRISLKVNRFNEIAIRFYENSGFRKEGEWNNEGYISMEYILQVN